MTTATQTRRLQRRFELWDGDHDGKVTRSDYEAEANRTIRAFGEPPDSPAALAVVTSYLGIWDHLAGKAGIASDGAMNASQFTSVIEQEMLTTGDAGFDRVLRRTLRAIIDLVDSDGDHLVNKQEFHRWGKAIGLSEMDIDRSFTAIDKDHDGRLDTDELVEAVRDYHMGTSDVPLLGR